MQAGRRHRVWNTSRLCGNLPTLPEVVGGLLRDQRGFVEAVQDELRFARIAVDVANREDAGTLVSKAAVPLGSGPAPPMTFALNTLP